MKLSETQRKFPLLVANFIEQAYGAGYELSFGEAFRTEEQQRLYVRSGKSRTMSSAHMERLAVDFNLFKDGRYLTDGSYYRPLGEIWESLGGRWGGRFGVEPADYGKKTGWDANHFEYRG